MTPALSKTAEKVSSIHISSPVSHSAVLGLDLDPQHELMENSFVSLAFVDSCSSKSPSDLLEVFLPYLINSSTAYETVLLSNSSSLIDLVYVDKKSKDLRLNRASDDSVAVFKGSKGAAENHSNYPTKANQHVTQSVPLEQCLQKERESPENTVPLVIPSALSSKIRHVLQKDALKLIQCSLSHMQTPNLEVVQAEMEAQKRRLASQHAVLTIHTGRAKQRLHALLAENAIQHFNKQLEGLRTALSPKDGLFSPANNGHFTASVFQEGCASPSDLFSVQDCLDLSASEVKQVDRSFSSFYECSSLQKFLEFSALTELEISSISSFSDPFLMEKPVKLTKDIQSLTRCGQAVLSEAQKALDSDATESGSDEDDEHEETLQNKKGSGCLGCEWQYHWQRAKLASHWTWIKFRLSELKLQIQQISRLHQDLLAKKKCVILAKSQPLTDKQIQQSLLTEMADLTFTAANTHCLKTELDTEPFSPTRLLRNIEKQSAELSQLVNSLSPLHTPVAKQSHRRRRCSKDRVFNSEQNKSVCFWSQPPPHLDRTCAAARTRPLLTCYKRRLYTMDQSSFTKQEPDFSTYQYTSCACGNAMNVCLEPTCSSNTYSMVHTAHNMLTSQDCMLELQVGKLSRHRTKTTSGMWSHGRQVTPNHRQSLKRPRRDQGDTDMCVAQSDLFSPSSVESIEDGTIHHHTHERNAQKPVRKKKVRCVYDQNNIVFPILLAAPNVVEKQDIPTPSWRAVNISPLLKKKKKEQNTDKVEVLTDEVFSRRHRRYERREKLSWSCWEKSRTHTRRLSNRGCMDASSDSLQGLWTCSTPEDLLMDNMEERESQSPWERRVFPLSEEEYKAVTCDYNATDEERLTMDMDTGDSQCTFPSHTSLRWIHEEQHVNSD